MNKFECLHETPIRAAIELLDLIKKHDPEEIFDATKRSPYASTSIAKIASNMTLVFPVMCSNTLHIDTDMMIMKAIERKCAVMLQILFSAYQVTDVKDAQEFIGQFHSNIRLSGKASVDDFIALGAALESTTSLVADKATLARLSKDFRENCFFVLEDDIAPTSIAQNYMGINERQSFGKYPNDPRFEAYGQNHTINHYEPTKKKTKDGGAALSAPESQKMGDLTSGYDDDMLDKAIKDTNTHEKEFTPKGKERDFDVRDMKDVAGYFQAQILDNDVKKANELVPTTMVVNFTTVSAKSGRAIPVENIVIGIKARMIPVDSDDIINHLLTKLNDRNYILQLIRATTREISFFKDFILAVDNAKIEALARSKRGSSNPMWKVLERRAKMSRAKRFVGIKGNNANAITTLVVSQEEVDYVRKNFNKNLDSIKVINELLDAYNLLGFVVVDESLETAKFKFDDGEDFFETLAFSTLEKESSDNSYKKIVNLMSKLS